MPPWLQTVLAILAFLGVSGTLAPFLAARFRRGGQAELEEHLKRRFATKHELNNFRASIEQLVEDCSREANLAQEGVKLALGNADHALDGLVRVEAEQRHFNHRLVEEVLKPLQSMANEQKKVGENLAAQTALLQRLMNEMDRRGGK